MVPIVREHVKFAEVGTSSGLLLGILGVKGWRQPTKVQCSEYPKVLELGSLLDVI